MRKKKITIDHDLWDQIKKIKDLVYKKDQHDSIPIDEVLSYALSHYEKFLKKSGNLQTKHKKFGKPTTTRGPSSIAPPDLAIPPPPKKKPIKLKVDQKDLAELTKKETKDIKYILIECQFCGSKPITMPVPKEKILNSELPVVDISYVHGNPEHVIVAQLDHDFQVRRRRASWVLFEKDFK